MNVPARPLAEITERAIHLLSREMGVVDTLRFLNQFVTGTGNYTEEREALFPETTLDEILTSIRGGSPLSHES